jgi:hypothetical protein
MTQLQGVPDDLSVEDALVKAFTPAILHLNGITDPTLLVLKGHLLIESALSDLLKSRLPSPQFFDEARLRFPQLVFIARATFGLSKHLINSK